MAMGRPQKPHTCSWIDPNTGTNEIVAGLYKCPDGRWRVNRTGQKFTEPDERRAVQRYRDIMAKLNPPQTVSVGTDYHARDFKPLKPVSTANGTALPLAIVDTLHEQGVPRGMTPPELRIGYEIPETIIWPWLREMFITKPEYVARMTSIPELANVRHFVTQPPIKLQQLIDVYRERNGSSDEAKERCIANFKTLMEQAEARTLDDLTTEKLKAYVAWVESKYGYSTKKWMYGQIKSLIGFGLKEGLDEKQINAALGRCKVLWTPEAPPVLEPRPITREAFHALLKAAGDGPWRAWLLVGLNFGMHVDEVCEIECRHIDIDAGTYTTIRTKTKRQRIPRAAVLWPETVQAIKPMMGKQYLFTSPHGTRYNVRSRCNLFAELREKAGLPKEITFDSIRDGAYTHACRGSTEQLARVLAGQRAAGLLDNYVLRDPDMVRPACEAVYRHYGPFEWHSRQQYEPRRLSCNSAE